MRIAVGIPSFQEADSIAHVVTQVDIGLTRLANAADCIIANIDGASPDGTSQVFLNTPTRCRKHAFVVSDRPGGKGRNVLRFLHYCHEAGVDAMAMVDADIASITPDWINGLLIPLCKNDAHYVSPLYRRSRFDGGTTYHFAYPLMYGVFGRDVRQPIGGDFGLSNALLRYLLEQSTDASVYGYGIDIFMTMHAVGGGFKVAQATLGRKIHKSSFPKIPRIFPEVASTVIAPIRQYGIRISEEEVGPPGLSIDDSQEYGDYRQAQALFAESRARAADFVPIYRGWLGADFTHLQRALDAPEPRISSAVWTDLLAAAICAVLLDLSVRAADAFVQHLAPLFAMRLITFCIENWRRDSSSVHEEIVAQARLFRRKLISRSGLTG